MYAVNAPDNWWGSLHGPTTTANPGGNGTSASANVSFTPWIGVYSNSATVGFYPTGITLYDANVTGVSTATATGGVEGGTVATLSGAAFTDSDTGAPSSDFTVTAASWGDTSTSKAGLTVSGSGGNYTVNGSHRYTEEGTYSFSITVTAEVGPEKGQTATITGTTTVADANLTGATNATAINGVEGVTAASLSGARFTDANTGAPSSNFTVTAASWGDGNISTAGLTVSGSGGSYTVSGSHRYIEQGTYSFSFTVTDDGGQTATITGSTTVADANLTGVSTATAAGGVEGVTAATLSGASFTDANTRASSSNFTVTAVDWGDNSTDTTGLMVSGSGGSYTVSGAHLYAEEGTYNFSITVKDDGGKTAIITGSTTVVDASLTGESTATATGGVEGVTPAALSGASFTDANAGAPSSDFTVTAVDWGDTSTDTTGLTVSGSGGSYKLNCTQLYSWHSRY
jgi:hypothetical protein